MCSDKKHYDEVELYFGVAYEEVGEHELNIMCRIQVDYDNGTSGKDISYYASLYGY